ncbi:MAG: hypothetical protein U0271_37720 [Polyangiaceae bacterium]
MTTLIAPSLLTRVEASSVANLRVRVRSFGGRPLAGATVYVFDPEDPRELSVALSAITDKNGLAELSSVEYRRDLKVTAVYEAHHGAATPVAAQIPTVVVRPSAAGADVPVVWVTLRARMPYALRHLFGWQNPELRRRVYYNARNCAPGLWGHEKDDPKTDRRVQLAELAQVLDSTFDSAAFEEERKAELQANSVEEKRIDRMKKERRPARALAKALGGDSAVTASDWQVARAALEAQKAAVEQASHDELLQRLLRLFADKRAAGTPIPDWYQYGILHLTGLRYKTAYYVPPARAFAAIRAGDLKSELARDESGSPNPGLETSLSIAAEYAALLAEPTLLASVQERFLAAKSDAAPKPQPPTAESIGALAKPEAWQTRQAAKHATTTLTELSLALTETWLREATEAAPADGFMSPEADYEVLGDLLDRHFGGAGPLPGPLWQALVQRTQLVNDFADQVTDFIEDSSLGNGKATISPDAWGANLRATGQPYFTGLVCNEVATALQWMRGASTDNGRSTNSLIGGYLRYLHWLSRGVSLTEADYTRDDFVGLYFPQSVSAVRVGDVILFAGWSAHEVYKTDVQYWNVTAASFPAEMRVEAVGSGLVRRDKEQFFAYIHIATVVGFDDATSPTALHCFETDHGIGHNTRAFSSLAAGTTVFGRLPIKQAPDLAWFLREENILRHLRT